jgi:hypothetical protein
MLRHPYPPADLQHLLEVKRVNGHKDVNRDDLDKSRHRQATRRMHVEKQQMHGAGDVIALDRIEEIPIPEIQNEVHPHHQQVQCNDRNQHQPAEPAFFRRKIRL